ncbi:MAG: hypothetical protein D6769_02775 [Methanobacteriota archaeon]|nr:MAG: hypothetical protein D6769_02775 [Euryarchaeota archaeon]
MAGIDKRLLRSIYEAFASRNARRMRKLNDKVLNSLIISGEKEAISLAIITYALSKILSKRKFGDKKYNKHMDHIEQILLKMSENGEVSIGVGEVKKELVEMESKDPRYIFSLITKSKVKMAATLYAKGMSLSSVVKLFGIAKEEVLSYAGKTMMFDRVKEEVPVKKRVEEILSFVGVE